MKKRKELDALVNNGKLGKRNKLTTAIGHELLRHETDSSDMEDFSILQPRKRPKKGGIPSRLCTTCFPLCLFLLVTACVAASGTLVWLHLGLREDMDRFRINLQKVEAEGEGTPETLHSIHSHLKSLHTDITFLENKFVKATSDIASITQEIDRLKETANNLKASVAAAPEIQTLPKNVESLTESIANIGSKITALETTTKDLKSDYSGLKKSTETLNNQMEVVKAKLDEVKAKQQLAVVATAKDENQDAVSHLQKEMKLLKNTIDKLNNTFTMKLIEFNNLPLWFEAINRSVLWAVDDLHQHHAKIQNLYYFVHENLTVRLENIESKWDDADDPKPNQLQIVFLKKLINQTVNEVLNDKSCLTASKHLNNGSWKETMKDIHQLITLYINILQQFNNSAENSHASEQLAKLNMNESIMKENKFQILNNTDKLRSQFLALQNFVRKADNKLQFQFPNNSQVATTRIPSVISRLNEQTVKENYSTAGSLPNQYPSDT